MKATKPSKTTRARKATKDLALTGRETASKVAGGCYMAQDLHVQDLRAVGAKVEENRKMKEQI